MATGSYGEVVKVIYRTRRGLLSSSPLPSKLCTVLDDKAQHHRSQRKQQDLLPMGVALFSLATVAQA